MAALDKRLEDSPVDATKSAKFILKPKTDSKHHAS